MHSLCHGLCEPAPIVLNRTPSNHATMCQCHQKASPDPRMAWWLKVCLCSTSTSWRVLAIAPSTFEFKHWAHVDCSRSSIA